MGGLPDVPKPKKDFSHPCRLLSQRHSLGQTMAGAHSECTNRWPKSPPTDQTTSQFTRFLRGINGVPIFWEMPKNLHLPGSLKPNRAADRGPPGNISLEAVLETVLMQKHVHHVAV